MCALSFRSFLTSFFYFPDGGGPTGVVLQNPLLNSPFFFQHTPVFWNTSYCPLSAATELLVGASSVASNIPVHGRDQCAIHHLTKAILKHGPVAGKLE